MQETTVEAMGPWVEDACELSEEEDPATVAMAFGVPHVRLQIMQLLSDLGPHTVASVANHVNFTRTASSHILLL